MDKMLDELKKLNKEVEVPEGFSSKVIEKIKHENKVRVKTFISALSLVAVIVIAVVFVDYSGLYKESTPEVQQNLMDASDNANIDSEAHKSATGALKMNDMMTVTSADENKVEPIEKEMLELDISEEIKSLLEINEISIIECNKTKIVANGDLETIKMILADFSVNIVKQGENVEINL
jgi:hypothetical protein